MGLYSPSCSMQMICYIDYLHVCIWLWMYMQLVLSLSYTIPNVFWEEQDNRQYVVIKNRKTTVYLSVCFSLNFVVIESA